MLNKKAISPVVATALLLVVAVVAVVGFQGWFQTFSSNLFVDVEQQGSISNLNLGIETLVGNTLYIKAGNGLNITSISIDGNDCAISGIYYNMSSIYVSECLELVSTSSPEIVLVTNMGVSSKKVLISNQAFSNNPTQYVPEGSPMILHFELPTDGIMVELPFLGLVNVDIDWGDSGSNSCPTSAIGIVTCTYLNSGNYTILINGSVEHFGGDFDLNSGILIYLVNENFTYLTEIESWGDLGIESLAFLFVTEENLDLGQPFQTPILPNWIPNSVINMNGLFIFNNITSDITNWDVSNVVNMSVMFGGGTYFNQPLNSWDVSSVIDMNGMFGGAISFNQPLDNWDVSSVTNMVFMFQGASSFNQPLDSWDVSNVVNMSGMFSDAFNFDRNVNIWNVSSVIDMSGMFGGASSFNQPLNNWDVSSVTRMRFMFSGASSFNQSLNNWDVSSVTNLNGMFYNAISFNQNLTSWCVTNIASEPSGFALNSPLDTNGFKPIWGACP